MSCEHRRVRYRRGRHRAVSCLDCLLRVHDPHVVPPRYDAIIGLGACIASLIVVVAVLLIVV